MKAQICQFSKSRRTFCGTAAADLQAIPQFLRQRLETWSAQTVATRPKAALRVNLTLVVCRVFRPIRR
jgi:hypothetical protein